MIRVTFQNFRGAEKRLRKSDALFSGLALDTHNCIFKIYVTKESMIHVQVWDKIFQNNRKFVTSKTNGVSPSSQWSPSSESMEENYWSTRGVVTSLTSETQLMKMGSKDWEATTGATCHLSNQTNKHTEDITLQKTGSGRQVIIEADPSKTERRKTKYRTNKTRMPHCSPFADQLPFLSYLVRIFTQSLAALIRPA